MTAINSTMFDTPNRGNQSSNINQLTPDWVNIAYQENDSLLAGNNVSSTYTNQPITVALNYSITGNQSAKIYANQPPKFTGNQSGEYFSGYKSADILRYSNLSHSKRGEFTPFAKGDFSHLSKVGKSRYLNSFISKNGEIEFCESIKGKVIEFFESIKKGKIELLDISKNEEIEFLQSIKKGSQSATLGNVDIKYRASENINISLLLWYGKYQFLGSMPRDCNSFRITLLIHAARDSSPSCACATSIISRSSGSSLNWNGGFPRLSVLCVDTSITPVVWYLCVITHYTLATQKTMPRSGGTLTGHLTTNDNTSIEVAMPDHNTPVTGRTSLTPNQSYRWLFLALNRSDYTAKPCRIAVTAPNENSARLMLVRDYMLIFAGRLPAIGGKHHA
ncbi:host cell division inhibitor Icd-like protein [Providencia rettgeri]|nr:host cell division inhibitor Icd-like protein [Providencia rettgeri]ELR5283524.1 host cell division inhibitor Icd-like protein [Providencia rettgeri]